MVTHVLGKLRFEKLCDLCDLCSQSVLSFLGMVREFVVFVGKPFF